MKTKIISIIIIIFFFGCTGVLAPESVSEKIYISTQGYDQINILNSIDGEIKSEQNIISVNYRNKKEFYGGIIPILNIVSQFSKNVTALSVYNKKH